MMMVARLIQRLALGALIAVTSPALSADPEVTWGVDAVSAAAASSCGDSAGFGVSMAVDGDVLAIGADRNCGDLGSEIGAVMVFDRVGAVWQDGDFLERPGAEAGDLFGRRLTLTASSLVVAAPGADDGRGAVEVFTRIGRRFRAIATLLLPQEAPTGVAPAMLGASLAAEATTIFAGAPGLAPEGVAGAGAVLVYRRDATDVWGLSQTLLAPTPSANAAFGAALAFSGNFLAVQTTSSIEIFERRAVGDPLVYFQTLVVDSPIGLAFYADRLAVVSGAGETHIRLFDLDPDGFIDVATLMTEAPATGPVALSAAGLSAATTAGVAYFAAGPSGYAPEGRINDSPTSARALQMTDAGVIITGADDTAGVYRRVATTGQPCANSGECVSGFCADAVCCESACGSGQADCRACSVAAGSSEDGKCEVAEPGTICRSSLGECDQEDICDGTSAACPADRVRPVGTICREEAGICDVAESCTGVSPFCPRDEVESVGVVCRATAGLCDLPEACDGVRPVCPADRVMTAGVECRERTGTCDRAELCDGAGPRCPRDLFQPFGFVCRPATSNCDAAETCNGFEGFCATDAMSPDGTACADGIACTEGDQCLRGRCMSGPDMCTEVEPVTPNPEPDPTPTPTTNADSGGCGGGQGGLPWWAMALALLAMALRGSRRILNALAVFVFAALMATGNNSAFAQDSDGDGVLDAADICLGPDGLDGDGDGVPSGCDCDDDNADIFPGAPDICNNVDDDCDGRLDVNTALAKTGGQLFSDVASGAAVAASRATLSVTDSGETLHVKTGNTNHEYFYARPINLFEAGGRRSVQVAFRRERVVGPQNVGVGISDGSRVVVFNLAGSIFGSNIQPTVSYGGEGGSGNGYTPYSTQYGTSRANSDSYLFSFDIGLLGGTVAYRSAAGATQTFNIPAIYLPRLDRGWKIVLVALKNQTIDISQLELYQDIAHTGDSVDADGDGFPTSCDCDDTNATIFPGALDLCDGVDADCGGDGDGLTHISVPGVGLLSDVRVARASNPSSRALTAASPSVRVGPGDGPSDEIFYRRDFSLVGAGTTANVDITLEQGAMDGSQNLRVGLTDGTTILAAGIFAAGAADGTQYAVGPHWGNLGDGVVEEATAGASDVVAEAGPFRFTFRLGANSRLTVRAGNGAPLSRDFPASVGTLDLTKTLSVIIYADAAEETYDVKQLVVQQGPLDADQDGVCDTFDRCIGDDAGPDSDRDGFVAACDCDDTQASVSPYKAELCDGVDQDCDGRGDVRRLAGARGSELLGRINGGHATNPSGARAYAARDGNAVMFPARGVDAQVLYREPLTGLRTSDDPTQITFELAYADVPTSPELAIMVSDGTLAIGARVAVRQAYGTTTLGPNGLLVIADDNGETILPVTENANFGLYVDRIDLLRATLSVPVDQPATMLIELVDLVGAVTRSATFVIADGRLPTLDATTELIVVALEADTTYALADVRVSQGLLDTDLDGTCDALDRCASGDDSQDADGDLIPDACDICLGPDGTGDLDGDGFPSGCDCNDRDANINPAAVDSCNAIDDDCDGSTDRFTALRVRGAEFASNLASGRAEGGPRAVSGQLVGAVAEFAAGGTVDYDVYYRQPLELLSSAGSNRQLRLTFDRDSRTGDHDFQIALSDGNRVFGVGLYDVQGGGVRYRALPLSGTDDGATVAFTLGEGGELDDASPYTVEMTLGSGASLNIRAANNASLELTAATGDAGRLNGNSLWLLLIGNAPHESYRVRSVAITQTLEDSDGDFVCDAVDFCPGEDDLGVDSDQDGIVDPCDICPLADDNIDTDGDGVPDACDLCEGSDDAFDQDRDGLPDGCDLCPEDPANDSDGDGICDQSDICLKGDDTVDSDADGIPDACDPCPTDADGDSDEDGTCDSADICLGDDRSGDKDGDGYCADRDCDDTRQSINPGADEICDGFDSDCNGLLGFDEFDTNGDFVIQCKEPQATPSDEEAAGCGGGRGREGMLSLWSLLVLTGLWRRSRQSLG